MSDENTFHGLINSHRQGSGESHGLAGFARSVSAAHFSNAAAIRGNFESANVHAAALAGASSAGSGHSAAPGAGGNLTDVSQKLDDAATKMEKAFSGGKTIILLGD